MMGCERSINQACRRLIQSALLAFAGALLAKMPAHGATAVTRGNEPAAPLFSIEGGFYTKPFKLILKGAKGEIHYSNDGSEPDKNAEVFKSPIEITNSTIIRAKVFYPDGSSSEPVSQRYLLASEEVLNFKSSLPLIVVNSFGGEIDSAEKIFTSLTVISNAVGQKALGTADRADHLAFLHVRGHSSLRYPKHSYAVKLLNEMHEAQKSSLLGLSKDSDWVLYGPYPDKTLLRDMLAYDLSNAMGRWAPHGRFVEVFINEGKGFLTMAHYAGVYVLLEKVNQGKERVDIKKISIASSREPELSGGYIFKKDHTGITERKKFGAEGPPQATQVTDRTGYPTPPGGFPADPAGFLPPYGKASNKPVPTKVSKPVNANANAKTKKPKTKGIDLNQPHTNYLALDLREGTRAALTSEVQDEDGFRTSLQRNQFYFHEPEPDDITPVQRAWLRDYVNRFETALYGPEFTHPTKGYRAYIDSDSFIDHHLLVEATKNVDGFRFSTFFYKDRGGKINMGPVWDWNLSFGNASGKQGYMPEHWLWPQLDDQQYSWFRRLFEDPDFGQRYVDRWAELRTNVLATSNVFARIDAMVAQLKEAQARNFTKWEIMGVDISPNYFVGGTYGEEIDWMKEWTGKRLAWMEAQFLAAPRLQRGTTLEMKAAVPEAKIYYTLDGSDPRASGGEPAGTAKEYQAPIATPKSGKIIARTRSGARWSAPVSVSGS